MKTFSPGVFLSVSLLLANGFWPGLRAAENDRVNVLYIMADDMRPDGISALGNPDIQTPHLDTLVKRGMSFSNTYVMGANSGAVCTPSRTMVLSGRTVFHHPNGGFAKGEKGPETLWPKAMSAGGYETFHLGKKGNSYKPGMDAFDTCLFTEDIGAKDHEVSAKVCADRIIEFLEKRKADRPFFIYWAPPVPHDPRIAPKEYMDLYDPAKIPLPKRYRPVHPFDNGEMTVRDERLAPWPRTEEVVKRHLADAYACVTCFDHHMGRVVDRLRRSGQLERTIVVFAADNGLSLGDHGLMGKQNLYEFGGMHVPLVFAGPGIPHGTSEAFAYLFDVYPTVCELTGTPIPKEVEGKSLAPVITGKATRVRDAMLTAYRNGQRALRDEQWKLIRYPLVDKTQLFDLKADPIEMEDLAAKPEHAGRVQAMLERMKALQKELDDPVPLTVDSPTSPDWTPPADDGGAGGGTKGGKRAGKKGE
jgi:arylsulfatase A-like enzyme